MPCRAQDALLMDALPDQVWGNSNPMTASSESRSHRGCWTCRIRHRKCDEGVPACEECSSRHIRCHGYGRPPAWTQDPRQLRQELQKIKDQIKKHVRLTSKARNNRPASPEKPAFKPQPVFQTYREAELLMHYLDRIFIIQFPYYVESGDFTSRGWLFFLLTRKGPLRQAALTLAALHRQSQSQHKTDASERLLLTYHTSAMQELRAVISRRKGSPSVDQHEEWIDFMACGIALISFEVFSGGANSWMPHMKALVASLNEMEPHDLVPAPSTSIMEDEDETSRDGHSLFVHAAQKFLIAELLWFDIMSCAATGTRPHTAYRKWLQLEDIDVSTMTGCQNWVMLAIGDVYELCAQMSETSSSEASSRIIELYERLDNGLKTLGSDVNEASRIPLTNTVTRIYATAAIVILHALASDAGLKGWHMDAAVENVIDAIKRVPANFSLRGVPWALYIAGGVANNRQQTFFRDLLDEMLGEAGSGFTNCEALRKALQHIWAGGGRLAESGTLSSVWPRAMAEMGSLVLLV